MELSIDSQNRELKLHGTYGFPVYVDRKLISSYATGYFPWHWHDEVEFTLVVSGKIEYRVNESRFLLEAEQGLFCNSGSLHFGSMVEGDCDYISITFHPRLLAGFEGSALGSKYIYPLTENGAVSSMLLLPQKAWHKKVLEELYVIYDLCREREPLYELHVQRNLLDVWTSLYAETAQQAEQANQDDPEKLQRLRIILSYIHDNYAQHISLDDIARQVGLCKSECCRFFKRQMGASPFDYLLDYRVGRSLGYLQDGASVAQAAEAVGFSDASYFSKVFRSRTGRSPSKYRKEAWGHGSRQSQEV